MKKLVIKPADNKSFYTGDSSVGGTALENVQVSSVQSFLLQQTPDLL